MNLLMTTGMLILVTEIKSSIERFHQSFSITVFPIPPRPRASLEGASSKVSRDFPGGTPIGRGSLTPSPSDNGTAREVSSPSIGTPQRVVATEHNANGDTHVGGRSVGTEKVRSASERPASQNEAPDARALLESAYDAMMMDERQHDLSELDIRRFVRVLDQVWSWTFSS